ncbi:MAG: Abi family protein [Bacteroidales bacterium]|jgi:abortive infection bacteriophage resistance protein|nr:Abi family protein [Bacteroidales bacterium]
MDRIKYDKPSLNFKEQVDLLIKRGMIIDDRKRAERLLANISYYRLSAYMLPYKINKDGVIIDRFRDGTNWNEVYRLYLFDRKLRLLVFDAIERIEIAIRTQIIYQLSQKYGSHWQDKREIFKAPRDIITKDGMSIHIDIYDELQKHISNQLINNHAEEFLVHYRNTYCEPVNPPSWMCVEIMFFNQLLKICNGLKKRSDLTDLSNYFSLPPSAFCSWLHTLNFIRNICAHHARLWNRTFNIVPEKLIHAQPGKVWLNGTSVVQTSRCYYLFSIINYFLQTANPTSSFKLRLVKLLTDYEDVVSLKVLGFPEDWKKEEMWSV